MAVPLDPDQRDLREYLAECQRWRVLLELYEAPLRVRAQQKLPLTTQEEHFVNAYVFWTAIILEGGLCDVRNGTLRMRADLDELDDSRADLQAIGATGTVQALEQLLHLHKQQHKSADREEFYRCHQAQIAEAIGHAEGEWEYADLLLRYAEAHLRPH